MKKEKFTDMNVQLYNGSMKNIKDICVGDELIGDDGEKRIVLTKTYNYGKLYEIIQNRGDNYIVNENHMMTLHMQDHKVIFWNKNGWNILWWDYKLNKISSKFYKSFDENNKCNECGIVLNSSMKRHYDRIHPGLNIHKTRKLPERNINMDDIQNKESYEKILEFSKSIDDNNVIDISIKDYLSMLETTKKRLAGVRCMYIKWDNKDVFLDPYVLGLWLGDGMKDGYSYSCDGDKDIEIMEYLKNWGEKNDAQFKKTPHYIYNISSISNYGKKNHHPLRKLLKIYNLINNKHIPKEYLVNSKDVRLNVLAGLIDTDGHVSRNGSRIIISQSYKHEKLVNDIVYLSRSLGYCTSVRSGETKYTIKNGEKITTTAYYINISGNIGEIPTKLPRKKCIGTFKQNTDKSTGYIKVNEIKEGEYINITTDKKRILLDDFTVICL